MGGRGVPTSTCEEVEQPAAAQANAARYDSRNRSVIAEPPCQAFYVPAALNPRAPAPPQLRQPKAPYSTCRISPVWIFTSSASSSSRTHSYPAGGTSSENSQ